MLVVRASIRPKFDSRVTHANFSDSLYGKIVRWQPGGEKISREDMTFYLLR